MEKPYSQYCKARRETFAQKLQEMHISAAVFEDTEDRRDSSIRYFTGHPGDAILVITAKGESMLCPWDENIANSMADVEKILPFTKFSRNSIKALATMLRKLHVPEGSRIDIPPYMPYPTFLHYVDELQSYNILCREKSSHEVAVKMRGIKDKYEVKCIQEAAKVTDQLINLLEEGIKNGTIKTEADAALLIERESRLAGCEGTGFNTLAAGSNRSFGIHCFPPYTAAPIAQEGLSIIDFGVVKDGYTSDVTLTFAAGKLSATQEKQLDLVQNAYNSALEFYQSGIPIKMAAAKADAVFEKAKCSMPHSLGHGIGLEAHEFPIIKQSIPQEIAFLPGMVVTLEPGLYNPLCGGCRLENDILITENGQEVLTHSRIIRL